MRDVAVASFLKRGYDGTTLRLIAREASVSLGKSYKLLSEHVRLMSDVALGVSQRRPLELSCHYVLSVMPANSI